MTVVCTAPDASLAVAMRLSAYLDCQARALGENGFQALAGGPWGTALVTACVTLFVAMIGYRLMLGHTPGARDGVGWMLRLGIVLALVTSWPAFQALVYRVAVDGPAELAAIVMPAAALPAENLDFPIQQAYDVLRIGTKNDAAPADAEAALLPPMPITASVLVMSTAGLSGALRVAIGFLLAVAPLALVSLLFGGAIGLFNGWLRALGGLALALVGSTIVTAVELTMIESELVRLQAVSIVNPLAVDRQAMTTIVACFAIVALVTVLVAARMASAVKLSVTRGGTGQLPVREVAAGRRAGDPLAVFRQIEHRAAAPAARARTAAVADALLTAVQREQRSTVREASPQRDRHAATAESVSGPGRHSVAQGIGLAGRRGIGRPTTTSARRDRMS